MKKEVLLIFLIVGIVAILGLIIVNSELQTPNFTTGLLSYEGGQNTLTVSTSGKGYVSSYPSGIECGYACSEMYSQGTTITLTAKSLGDSFSSWGGACSGSSTTCTLTLNSDKTVSANFGSAQQEQPKTIQPREEITYQRQITPASQEYPAACEDYPTMPGCPGEGTNITPPPQPSIPEVSMTGFEPRKGYERTVINIKGTNLRYVSRVYFGGELVEGFSVSPDGKELQTIVPQGAETGKITLVLTSGGAVESNENFVIWTGKCSNPDVTKAFNQLNKLPQGNGNSGECNITRYVRAYSNYKELRNAIQKVVGFSKLSPPKITRFDPLVALPGQEVSIFSTMLDVYADEIKFDEKTIPFTLVSKEEVKIKIPVSAVFGEHEITVVSDLHGSGSAKIKIVPLPAINSFNPKKVWTNEEITITGENFYEPVEISFYDVNTKKEILTKTFKAESLEQIKVNAPQTEGSYIITVKGKNSYVRTETTLTVETKPLPPEITSIEPDDEMLGNTAIVYGKNLKSVNSITLNGYQINYQKDDSETQKKIYVDWGIDHGLVEVKNPSGSAQAQLISNKNPVTKLITGKEETCFGGVGKGCYGSEDGKEEWSWGSQKIVAPVGCSQEVNGKRNCWVVPGSIKHDNCCARYPSGKMCGGPGKDGQPAGESNHNGKCVSEWDAAFWDVFWWRAFTATFDATKPTDLTPKESSRYTLKDDDGNSIPSETAETLRLCAPAGHELREQSDEKFCCSGSATNKKCTGGRGVQTLPEADEIKRTENGADLTTVPIPLAPGEIAKPTPPVQQPTPPPTETPTPVPTPTPPPTEKPVPITTPTPPVETPKPKPVRGRPIGDVCRGRRYCVRPVLG
ncbi:hypothetical protein HZA97_04355 [Candidatus Woesearchaeota archaeon]|nr:hypothetical protein [Candidatus Woesearchaeota archaeon]